MQQLRFLWFSESSSNKIMKTIFPPFLCCNLVFKTHRNVGFFNYQQRLRRSDFIQNKTKMIDFKLYQWFSEVRRCDVRHTTGHHRWTHGSIAYFRRINLWRVNEDNAVACSCDGLGENCQSSNNVTVICNKQCSRKLISCETDCLCWLVSVIGLMCDKKLTSSLGRQ